MILIDMEQGSPEWFQARAGRVTSSGIRDVIAKIKTGEASARKNYKAQKVAEILSGQSIEDGFVSKAMQHGKDWESTAVSAYEAHVGLFVERVGFVLHPEIEQAGDSPDGLVGDDGLIEIKCPNTATHIDYILGGVPPSEYIPQMAWHCACTGRNWCDFISFDPRMPDDLQLFIVRYTPEHGYISALEQEVKAFINEVNDMVSRLMAIKSLKG